MSYLVNYVFLQYGYLKKSFYLSAVKPPTTATITTTTMTMTETTLRTTTKKIKGATKEI